MVCSFGKIASQSLSSLLVGGQGGDATASLANRVAVLQSYIETLADIMDTLIENQKIIATNLETLWNRETVAKWHVTQQMIIPVLDANGDPRL